MSTIASVEPTPSSTSLQTVQGRNQARSRRMLQQLANRMGISPTALQDAYQSGRTPREKAANLLSAVADEVRVRPDALRLTFQQARQRATSYRSYYQPRNVQSASTLSALMQSTATRTSSATSFTSDSSTSTSTSAIGTATLSALGSTIDLTA